MVEEVAPNLYRIEIPLPRNPLKALNSYVVTSPTRNLMIDTGMNREECREAMQAGLNELRIDLNRTDFFITHLHADHCGLVASLATDSSKIFFSETDAAAANDTGVWDNMIGFAGGHGFPKHELRNAIERHPGYKYGPGRRLDFTLVGENDVISVGDYAFECVATPGHTGGHMCLYERKKRLLVSGDHVLIDITPNISLWSDSENPLKDYLASLDKINEFDIALVLPGHRRLFSDCRGRIDELKHHHQARAQEVLAILADGGKHAYDVASRMTWDIDCESWEEFPVSQKWFATGEAISHLKYLEEQGLVRRQVTQGAVEFSLR